MPGLLQAGDLVASTGSDDAKAKAVKVSIQYYVSITHAIATPSLSCSNGQHFQMMPAFTRLDMLHPNKQAVSCSSQHCASSA